MTPADQGEPSENQNDQGGKQDPEVLKQKIAALEERIETLEGEIVQKQPQPGIFTRLRENPGKFLYLLLALMLAILPPLLVFRDRWLNLPQWQFFLIEGWCQNEFLCRTSLPSYFGSITLIIVALFVGVLLWKEKLSSEPGNKSGDGVGGGAPKRFNVTSEQRKVGNILLLISGLLFLGFSLVALFSQEVISWGYLLAVILYASGWFLREVRLSAVWQYIQRYWRVILAFTIFQVALILALMGFAWTWDTRWVLLIIFGLSVINMASYYRQIPAILWVMNLALVLFSINITSWAFAAVGDEYAFFTAALDIAKQQNITTILANLFSGIHVYGTHPYLSSVIQAVSMKLLGANAFGWRFSNFYLSAVAIVFFYLFFKRFVGRSTALLIVILLAGSSYIMTFGKIGYNNLQSLLAMAVVLWASAWAVQSRRNLAYAAVGLSLGFCFYVYPAALYVIPLPILLMLIFDPPKSRVALQRWGIAILSLLIFILPLFFQPDYWLSKGSGLFTNNPEITKSMSSIMLHLFANLTNAFYSFLYIPHESHYVAVAYLDPLSAIFLLLGLIQTIKGVKRERFMGYALLSFVYLLLIIGATHDRRFPPTTRMFLLLPWFAFFVAMGIKWLVERFLDLRITKWSRTLITSIILVAIIGFNLYQAYSLSLVRSGGQQGVEAMFMRVVERLEEFEPTQTRPVTFLFLTDQDWNIDGFYTLMKSNPYPASMIRLLRFPITSQEIPEAVSDLISERNTLVILQPTLAPEFKASLGNIVEDLGKIACPVTEYTGKDVRFNLWHSPDLSRLCPED